MVYLLLAEDLLLGNLIYVSSLLLFPILRLLYILHGPIVQAFKGQSRHLLPIYAMAIIRHTEVFLLIHTPTYCPLLVSMLQSYLGRNSI